MLKTILGSRIRWHQPNGWIFNPVTFRPGKIEYTVQEGPHAGRHAIQHMHYHRIVPGIELTSWYEETGAVVNIIWNLESQTTHRFAAIPKWVAEDIQSTARDNQDESFLADIRAAAAKGPDGPRVILSDDGYFEVID
jgi:phenolic acid decarboxylase